VSHEVIKEVRGRRYRYEVQSYRDPASGKVRGRWRYLGRVVDAGGSRAALRDLGPTRERLLDALTELLESREFSEVTVSAIAERAGLAHGTFYRYFTDKDAALRAAALRVREQLERSRPDFSAPGSAAQERERIRAWVESLLRAPIDRPGLMREWYAALARDPELQAERAAKRHELVEAFTLYLRRLDEGGTIDLARPKELVEALLIAIDGAFRGLTLGGPALTESAIHGLVDLFERSIFGPPGSRPVRGPQGLIYLTNVPQDDTL